MAFRDLLLLDKEHLTTRLGSVNEVINIQQDSLRNEQGDDHHKLHTLLDR